jgi:nitrate reductase NapE component
MKNITRLSGYSSIVKAGRSRRGSILVFLIVLMVIFAVLGVGMVSMFGSSVLSVFASNSVRRANYLAESGLRYAISEVRNAVATGSTPEAALTNIDDGSVNGKWFNVSPGTARYQVRVYPYPSKTAAGTGVATPFVTTTTVSHSGFPPGFAIPGVGGVARLQVGGDLVGINSVVIAADRKTVTYNLASAVTIPLGASIYANLAFSTNASQPITKGSTATPLVLNINAVTAIPQKSGKFMAIAPPGSPVDGKLFTYQTAQVAGGNVRLENINWSYADGAFTFPAGSYLVFSPAVRLDSTGEHQQTQRVRTDYLNLSSSGSPSGPNQIPPALTASGSGFSDLSALDLTKSGDRVVVAGYIATGGTHAYWAAFQHLGEAGYLFADPEEQNRDIGFHVAPISNAISDNLRNFWMQYYTLSYDVQIKNGWDLNKYSGGSGIAIRWHENPLFQGQTPPGNDPYRYYQGYGITYMIYQDDKSSSRDMIPNNIKPPGNSLNTTLLLVLWEQKVDAGGVPRKDWLAYALLGDPSGNYHDPATERHPPDPDQKVTGYQVWPDGRLNDNATVLVRVEDKFVTTAGVTTRYNDIKVFYGDASQYPTFQNDSRAKDSIATNKQRARYYPQWLEAGNPGQTLPVINPQWPSNQFRPLIGTIANWYNDLPWYSTDPTSYDYFSLTSSAPTGPHNTVTWVKNNAPRTGFGFLPISATCNGYPSSCLLPDKSTFRTTDFTLDSFPSGRKEIGLVGMGDITGTLLTVAFDDFYIQILGGY